MGILLSIFSSKATWLLIAGVGLAIFFGIQQARISSLKNTIANQTREIDLANAEILQAKAQIARWKMAFDGVQATVDSQNAQIAKLESEVKKRIAAAAEAMKRAEISSVKAKALSDTIIHLEVSQDECTALRQLIDASLAGGLR